MTWQSAQYAANQLFPALLERVELMEEMSGKPSVIPISIYETDHDLATLRPEDGGKWSAAFHAMVMRALARKLRKKGFRCKLVMLNAAAYLRWLAKNGEINTAANRAAFIASQS